MKWELIKYGISTMTIFDKIIVGCIIIYIILVCIYYMFYKDKRIIVEQTLYDGTKQWAVKKNGFLGLPFLYKTETIDYGIYYCSCIYDTTEEAERYIESTNNKYIKKRSKRVLYSKRYDRKRF